MNKQRFTDDDPRDNRQAGEQFLDLAGLAPKAGSLSALGEVAEAFARLPYENVSKVLKTATAGDPESWRRRPLEVMTDHAAYGLGGTCYSLTHFLRTIYTRLGHATAPVLADMPSGTDRHCALVIDIGGAPYLIDPGYLICEPVRLPERSTRIATPRGPLLLQRTPAGRFDLYSESPDGTRQLRYSLKPSPVDAATFAEKWRDSFFWPQMNQLLITRYAEGGQLYLHNRHLRVIRRDDIDKRNLAREALEVEAAEAFGIDAGKIAAVRELLNARRSKRKL